jgi:hypothetical protein
MKNLLLLFIMIGACLFVRAQPGNRNFSDTNQRVRAMYVAYMTEQLNLDENTAQVFWPVQKQMHKDMKGIRDMQSNSVLEKEEAMLNIKKKYKDRFVKILGEERTNLFFIKDLEFRQKMVDRLQKRRTQSGKRRQGIGVRE